MFKVYFPYFLKYYMIIFIIFRLNKLTAITLPFSHDVKYFFVRIYNFIKIMVSYFRLQKSSKSIIEIFRNKINLVYI